jgi:hypothetical protein
MEDPESGYTKIGTCSWCHKENVLIYKDSERCENCDDRFTYCEICNEDQFEDDLCRHIFWSENYGWSGSGSSNADHDSIKSSLLKLLRFMPSGFAEDLKKAIQSKEFRTFTIGSMLGIDCVELYGMHPSLKYSHELLDLGSSDNAEETADGYGWLVTLCEDDTPEANVLTITWIDEFLKEPLVCKSKS